MIESKDGDKLSPSPLLKIMKTKICTKCNKEKFLTDFHKYSRSSDGVRTKCKLCRRENYNLNSEKLIKKSKQNYSKNSSKKKAYQRQYRWDHLKEDKLRKKKYAEKNKVKIAEYQKEYLQAHKEERNKQSRKRYSEDINFKLRINLRNRINAVLKGNIKSQSTIDLISCTIEELKKHLQTQFTRNMNWDNCGLNGWEIDHRIPCASYDLSNKKQQKVCFHYSNLQPMWAEENRSKADKILS